MFVLSFTFSIKMAAQKFTNFGKLFNIYYFIYLFLETGERREKGGEKHQSAVASCTSPTGDLVCNPGMCPD